MNKIFKFLKDPRVLYTGIGINCITFSLGFLMSDTGLMTVSLASAALCYAGVKLNSSSE